MDACVETAAAACNPQLNNLPTSDLLPGNKDTVETEDTNLSTVQVTVSERRLPAKLANLKAIQEGEGNLPLLSEAQDPLVGNNLLCTSEINYT